MEVHLGDDTGAQKYVLNQRIRRGYGKLQVGIKDNKGGLKWATTPPADDTSLPAIHWPRNVEGRVERWVEAHDVVTEEHSKGMVIKGLNSEYSSLQEWPYFPGPIEGYPSHEDNPFFGKTYPPILLDSGSRYCAMFSMGDGPHGMDKCALRFNDEHPLVQWIEASLQRRDINEQLHRGETPPIRISGGPTDIIQDKHGSLGSRCQAPELATRSCEPPRT